jgi:putative transposase
MNVRQVDERYRLPEAIWERMVEWSPRFRRSKKGGRPRLSWRQVLDGIFYVLRIGCQWKAAPPEFGSVSPQSELDFPSFVANDNHERRNIP